MTFFNTQYYNHQYFSPGYFGVLIEEEVEVVTGGTTGLQPKKKEISEEEKLGMEAIYSPVKFKKGEELPVDIIEKPEIVEVPEFTRPEESFEERLEFLTSKVDLEDDLRATLEKEQDIGLILAIIEAIE